MKTVLIVDDSPTMRRMVIASLQHIPGVHFEQASSGLEAIERLALEPVHLIILDLNMPDIHGYEVIEFVRTNQAFSAIPIVVLTTRTMDADRSKALQAGASVYLTKPFQPQVLAQHVVTQLEGEG